MSDRAPARRPLHEQVYETLRRRIDGREWKAGDQLPTEPQLAAEFGVSRGTTRQAVAALVAEGLVERTAGRGTFVSARPALVYPLGDLLGFTEQILSKGQQPSSRVIRVEVHDLADMESAFDFPPGTTRVLSVERVRQADADAVALEHLLLPWPRFSGIKDVDLESASVYETLEEHFAVQLQLGDFVLSIKDLNAPQAELLAVPTGETVFLMEGSVSDQNGDVVVGVKCYYLRDIFSFRFSMSRSARATPANTPHLIVRGAVTPS